MMKTQTIAVTHDVVMSADVDACVAILVALFAADAEYCAKVRTFKLAKLQKIIGTKLANDKRYSAAYAAGTLTYDVQVADAAADADQQQAHDADQQQAHDADQQQAHDADASTASKTKSAKAWLHELFSKRNVDNTPARYTLAELCALTGKSEVNVRTMLSDLRSAKYCKPYAPLHTVSTRAAGVTYYHMAA